MMNRKDFLKLLTLGGASFLGVPILGMGSESIRGSDVSWARLKFTCERNDTEDWSVHPHGDLNLMDHLIDNTTVNLEKKWNVANVERLDEMTRYPFLFMHAEMEPALSTLARANLREYLLRGGFLFAEDCVNGRGGHGFSQKNDFFFRKMIEEFPKILPEAKIVRLPNDHPIYHSFYHLPNGLPHMQGTPHGGHGVILNGRVVAFLSPSDNHCGWTNGDRWFSPAQQELAFKIGINIYVYAMTQMSVT